MKKGKQKNLWLLPGWVLSLIVLSFFFISVDGLTAKSNKKSNDPVPAIQSYFEALRPQSESKKIWNCPGPVLKFEDGDVELGKKCNNPDNLFLRIIASFLQYDDKYNEYCRISGDGNSVFVPCQKQMFFYHTPGKDILGKYIDYVKYKFCCHQEDDCEKGIFLMKSEERCLDTNEICRATLGCKEQEQIPKMVREGGEIRWGEYFSIKLWETPKIINPHFYLVHSPLVTYKPIPLVGVKASKKEKKGNKNAPYEGFEEANTVNTYLFMAYIKQLETLMKSSLEVECANEFLDKYGMGRVEKGEVKGGKKRPEQLCEAIEKAKEAAWGFAEMADMKVAVRQMVHNFIASEPTGKGKKPNISSQCYDSHVRPTEMLLSEMVNLSCDYQNYYKSVEAMLDLAAGYKSKLKNDATFGDLCVAERAGLAFGGAGLGLASMAGGIALTVNSVEQVRKKELKKKKNEPLPLPKSRKKLESIEKLYFGAGRDPSSASTGMDEIRDKQRSTQDTMMVRAKATSQAMGIQKKVKDMGAKASLEKGALIKLTKQLNTMQLYYNYVAEMRTILTTSAKDKNGKPVGKKEGPPKKGKIKTFNTPSNVAQEKENVFFNSSKAHKEYFLPKVPK